MGSASSADPGFCNELLDFIRQHWNAEGRGGAARAAWFEALVARGWSVPRWPVAHGGTGWDVETQCLWARETARVGAPEPDTVATTLVGPLLIALGSPAQQAELLPLIRDARVSWCLALSRADLELRGGGTAAATLSGELEAVPGAARADWLLCALAEDRLGLIDLAVSGVRRRTLTTLDGATDTAALILDRVTVSADRWIGIGATDAVDRIAAVPGAWPVRAFRERARLDALRTVAAECFDADGPLLEASELRSRLAQLESDLLGLEALERRAQSAQIQGVWTPARAALLDLRQAEIERALGVLTRDVLGYYSLPFPDSRLIDNEGPIGHDGALAMVAQALGRPGTPLVDVTGAYHHNTIARSLLGP